MVLRSGSGSGGSLKIKEERERERGDLHSKKSKAAARRWAHSMQPGERIGCVIGTNVAGVTSGRKNRSTGLLIEIKPNFAMTEHPAVEEKRAKIERGGETPLFSSSLPPSRLGLSPSYRSGSRYD